MISESCEYYEPGVCYLHQCSGLSSIASASTGSVELPALPKLLYGARGVLGRLELPSYFPLYERWC